MNMDEERQIDHPPGQDFPRKHAVPSVPHDMHHSPIPTLQHIVGTKDQQTAEDFFPDAAHPEQPPFGVIPRPLHTSANHWQQSFYDPTRQEQLSVYKKLPSGPASLDSGRLTGEGFSDAGWKQV